MSAHHVKHATLCPAYGNGELVRCTCGAPGSAKAKERALAMSPAEMVDTIDRGAEVARVRIARRGVERQDTPTQRERIEERSRTGSGYPGGGVDWSRYVYEGPNGTPRPRREVSANERLRTGLTDEQRALLQSISEVDDAIGGPDPEGPDPEGPEGDESDSDVADTRIESSADLAHALNEIEREVSRMLARRVAIGPTEADGYASLEIRQRCQSCRADLTTLIANDVRFGQSITAEQVRMAGEVGKAARIAYGKHRCEPIERSYGGWTAAELAEHAEWLERDGTEMVERSIKIAKLAAEREAEEKARRG